MFYNAQIYSYGKKLSQIVRDTMYHKWCSFIKVHTYSQNAISEVHWSIWDDSFMF